jgi:hypothetical protein
MAARKAAKPKKPNINSAADELIRMAEEGGVEQNFFFVTTFSRYKDTAKHLTRLQKEIEESELLIEKEYVEGVRTSSRTPRSASTTRRAPRRIRPSRRSSRLSRPLRTGRC